MRAHDISGGDLEEDLYLRGHRSLEEVALARLERSGDISFIKKEDWRASGRARSAGEVWPCKGTISFSSQARSRFRRKRWPRLRGR
jgi:hypothetical protein